MTGKATSSNRPWPVTAEQLNRHYAEISTDQQYIPPQSKATVSLLEPCDIFTEYRVFCMLEKIKPTAVGLDNIPDWFLRLAAPSFSLPLCHLFNKSLGQSIVPSQWKTSSITPVPKKAQPITCDDFRPISITPILSRVMEKEIVQSFFYPILSHPDYSNQFADQYAFRPTGSTTAALIDILHTVTDLLQTHQYVHIIALDFSKAFDSVRHHSLISKLADLPLPDYLHNWIIHNLTNRQHRTKTKDHISSTLPINASIIQGSGMGPVEYVCTASDLRAVSPTNFLCKFADDTYLIIPAANTPSIPTELQHITKWAYDNNLKLNKHKSVEMIVQLSRRRKQADEPPAIPEINRVDKITILGVIVSNTLSFNHHVSALIEKTTRTFYALKTLCAHGLRGEALWDVTHSTVISLLLYGSPAWWGFLKSDEKIRLQSVLSKAQRYGYLPSTCQTLDQLRDKLDQSLFRSAKYNPHHVLHRHLPPSKQTGYNLRDKSHNLTLPQSVNATLKQNFVLRMLFTDIY